MSLDVLCWCGFSHRGNHNSTAYVCQPFSVLKERPELEQAFRACGCDPSRGEVGIMLDRRVRRAIGEKMEAYIWTILAIMMFEIVGKGVMLWKHDFTRKPGHMVADIAIALGLIVWGAWLVGHA